MKHRFQNEDIALVSKQYANNDLYKAICTIGMSLEAELTGFGLCPEECFMETMEIVSFIAENGDAVQYEDLEQMWMRKYNEYMRFDRTVDKNIITKAVTIVFGFTALALDKSRYFFYHETIPRQLLEVMFRHMFDDWDATLDRIFDVPLPDGWFDRFLDEPIEEAEKATSRNASDAKTSARKSTAKKSSAKQGKATDAPMTLKYFRHDDNRKLKVQMHRVDILLKKWTEWKWIDQDTRPEDFDSLFKGTPRHCNINWTANATILTTLLQKLLDQTYITRQKKCHATSLVKNQFHKSPNSDASRLTDSDKENIRLSLFILDINNPLPNRNGQDNDEEDISDLALQEVFSNNLRSTKAI